MEIAIDIEVLKLNSAYERGGDARRLAQGVNFGFWSHLRCSGQNAIIFSREGLV